MPGPRLSLVAALLAAAVSSSACGAAKQTRPDVVSTFPADGAVLPGWLAAVRVTFDAPVTILNDAAVSCDALGPGGEEVLLRIFEDPADPTSILILPADGGHFFPDMEHRVTVREGAVVNGEQHYALDEHEFTFTMGPAPHLFVTAEDGSAYEVDASNGAQVSATLPGVGRTARSPLGTGDRVWVWLDPTVPGSSLLGTFVPGAATITDTVALTGETGTRRGAHMVLSLDGRTIYATAEDAGTGRLLVHRIDVATRTEILPALTLSPPLAGSPAVFQPTIDARRGRLFVPFSDGAGGGRVAVVDLAAWTELDVGPGLGVDALPVSSGAGDCSYEWNLDDVYMVLADETSAGIVRIAAEKDPLTFETEREPLTGRPTAVLALPDGGQVVYGLDGYAARDGLVRVIANDLGDGFPLVVDDDLGGVPQGSTHVVSVFLDLTDRRFFAIAENGVTSVLVSYEYFGDLEPTPVDFDAGTDGAQALDLGLATGGSIVTGATTLSGAYPP